MDPVHLNVPSEHQAPLSRGPWRSRSAYLTEQHTELDEVCTICQSEAHEGEMMCRLICRHMFHYRCWAAAVEAGPSREQERTATCPNCRGRGHVISCWHYLDTSISAQINPNTGLEVPNLLNLPAPPAMPPTTPRRPMDVPEEIARSLAPLLHTPERTTAQHFQIGTPSPVSHGRGSPDYRHELSSSADEGSTYVVLPNTFSDANEWITGYTGFQREATGNRQVESASPNPTIYHVETRLPNGKPALLLDIGSVGNLAGDEWVRQQAAMAIRAGLRPEQRKRERPLTVRGVGQGGEKCLHNCVLPVSLMNATGQRVTGTFDTPTVPHSQLPALLGLNAARESRMVIDTMRNTIYMAGPGEYDMLQALPPGTQQFNCILAPSGHMMIPCAEFPSSTALETTGRGRLQLTPQLALPVEHIEMERSVGSRRTRAVAYEAPN